MFGLWRFSLDVHQVMTARISDMMTGALSSQEARLMITEKQKAYSQAQIIGAFALWTDGPVEATNEMFKVYQRVVKANCSRLSQVQ